MVELRLSQEQVKEQQDHYSYMATISNAHMVGRHFSELLSKLPNNVAATKASRDNVEKVLTYLGQLFKEADEIAQKFNAQSIA
jgi:hypothetical protein